MAVFWGVSIPLYLDQRWTRPIWQACRARSGRDWMLNSGVTRLDWQGAGAATHMVAAGIFATYPYWLWRGVRAGRRAVSSNSSASGMLARPNPTRTWAGSS